MIIKNNSSEQSIKIDHGSFKDPSGRIYTFSDTDTDNKHIIRFLTKSSYIYLRKLLTKPFYQDLVDKKMVVNTYESNITPKTYGWDNALEHDLIPFITYPYEWPFSMLKDAAILHLKILHSAVNNGCILKDSSSFNIQWYGNSPVFIDIPSFIDRKDEEYWIGYGQFCNMFLYPLLITSHLGIDYQTILRSQLDGITYEQTRKYFRWSDFRKRGVLAHVLLPSLLNIFTKKTTSNIGKKQSRKNLLMLIDSLYSSINKLHFSIDDDNLQECIDEHYNLKKESILSKWISDDFFKIAWNINRDTNTITKLIASKSQTVISTDKSHKNTDSLYQYLHTNKIGNVIPLVIDIGNIPPNQGWQGLERKSLDTRSKIDIILCLKHTQDILTSTNISLSSFVEWLHEQKTRCIIEFTNETDAIPRQTHTGNSNTDISYTIDDFILEVQKHFNIIKREKIINTRQLFDLTPKS